jgi:hypothetical protein
VQVAALSSRPASTNGFQSEFAHVVLSVFGVAFGILAVFARLESMARKAERTYGVRRGSRKIGNRIDWFWEAYWSENGRDISR